MKPSTRLLIMAIAISLCGCSDFSSESKSKDPPRNEQVQGPPTSGKVINAMNGGGYTYMHLESNGKQFWIASSVINVKRNNIVSWEGGSVMTDFTSYALNRKFEEIHFVKSISIVR
ncbi:hypothetical protein [Kaarinaea lacus]